MLQKVESQSGRADPGATAQIISFITGLDWNELDASVRHAAKRHLLDTVGVMIAGAAGDLANKTETVLARLRPAGGVPVPGRSRRADMLDSAYLGGAAAHGIELDDGYRQGSAHPGCAVVPAVLAAAYEGNASGQDLLTAVVAGYEVMTAISAAVHPQLRQRPGTRRQAGHSDG